MENKVRELKEMGHDITSIIEGTKHPRVLIQFYKIHKNQDVVIPEWTEESITKFSNKVYDIVTKYGKSS